MTDSREDAHDSIANVQARIARLDTVEQKLGKLNLALGNLVVAAPKRQLAIIKAARDYVNDSIGTIPVQGMKSSLRIIENELVSMSEGIRAGIVLPQELVLKSGLQALLKARSLRTEAAERLTKLTSAQVTGHDMYHDENAHEITVNRQALELIPPFDDKPFIVDRAPIVFTSSDKSDAKFSKVGSINLQALEHQGFKATTLGGYTVLKKQLVIGINPHTLYKDHPTQKDANGKPVKIRLKVKEYADDGETFTRREKMPLDEAKRVKALVEKKTGTRYAFISDKSTSFRKGTWFWLMPESDVRRFAKAFGGGRISILTWGLAGAA